MIHVSHDHKVLHELRSVGILVPLPTTLFLDTQSTNTRCTLYNVLKSQHPGTFCYTNKRTTAQEVERFRFWFVWFCYLPPASLPGFLPPMSFRNLFWCVCVCVCVCVYHVAYIRYAVYVPRSSMHVTYICMCRYVINQDTCTSHSLTEEDTDTDLKCTRTSHVQGHKM